MSNALNKHESKYYNTACLMDEALLSLLEKKEIDFITVKEICAKAGVNRSTFYLHYESVDDLLQEALNYMTKKFAQTFQADISNEMNPVADGLLITPKYVLPYLEFLKEHRRVYLAALMRPRVFQADAYSERALKNIIFPILNNFNVPKEEQKFVLAFWVGGMHQLVWSWVKGGCKEDVEFVCSVMMKCIPKEN